MEEDYDLVLIAEKIEKILRNEYSIEMRMDVGAIIIKSDGIFSGGSVKRIIARLPKNVDFYFTERDNVTVMIIH